MKKLGYDLYEMGPYEQFENQDNNNLIVEGEIEDGKIKSITKISDYRGNTIANGVDDEDKKVLDTLGDVIIGKYDGDDVVAEIYPVDFSIVLEDIACTDEPTVENFWDVIGDTRTVDSYDTVGTTSQTLFGVTLHKAGATGSGTAIYQDGEDEVHYTVTFKLLKDVMSTPWNIEDVESFLTLHEDEAEITSVTKQ